MRYRPIRMEKPRDLRRPIGVLGQFVFQDLAADAGAVGDDDVATFALGRDVDNVIEYIDAGQVFMEDKVGGGGVPLDKGVNVKGAAHEVGEDADKGGLGHAGDLTTLAIAAGQREIGADQAGNFAIH